MNSHLEELILIFRGQRVLLDADLSALYQVPTKRINQQVIRNIRRFPPDFMFRLSVPEKLELVAKCNRFQRLKHSSSLPYAFTEQGVAMLSSVLNSEKAIAINIAIMRAFIKLRHALTVRKDLALQVERLEGKVNLIETDVRFIRDDLKKQKQVPENIFPKVKGFEG